MYKFDTGLLVDPNGDDDANMEDIEPYRRRHERME